MLHIRHPEATDQRWNWLLDVVMTEWLGIPHTRGDTSDSAVIFEYEGAELSVTNDFLTRTSALVPSTEYIPRLPLARWSLPEELGQNIEDGILPVMFGKQQFTRAGNKATLGLDVFGTVFFVLSRYEEVALVRADQHDRFPGVAGIAHRDGHLQRPIVDEYVEVFWNALRCVMPRLERRTLKGRTLISCDVDEPYERWIKSPLSLAKGVAGALVRRRSLRVAARRLLNAWCSWRGDFSHDPNWCFDWYMTVCEQNGLSATFYFIPTAGPSGADAVYLLDEPRIANLMRMILKRGHHIGMHASYESYRDPELLSRERAHLQSQVQVISPAYQIRENRQHFLRWRVQETTDHLEHAGFEVDASGGFADVAGFRFGTSRAFRMWSWKRPGVSELVQNPLTVMDGTLISYMNLELDTDGMALMQTLLTRCARYGGNFSLLWHNSNLETAIQRSAFEAAVCLRPQVTA
jgi:hypothetical protein